MNDLQEMLQLNIDEIEPESVKKLEKKRVLHNILKKKKRFTFRYAIAVSLLTCGIGSSVVLLSPTIASQIPIVQNIVDYFNGETTQFMYFDDYATVISSMQTSNGVTIEIADAVYDGTTVTIAFAIESEIDLGEPPLLGNPIETNGTFEGGGVTSIKKVTNTTYAGVITLSPELDRRSPRTVNLSWKPGRVWNYETDEKIQGDWSFEFKLKKINVDRTHVEYADTKEGFTFKIPNVDISGYTINIPFDMEMPSKYVLFTLPYSIVFEVTDEFGTEYEMLLNGASGTNKHKAEGSATFSNLQNDSKMLIITPKLVHKNEEILFDSFTVNTPQNYTK
ncbi:DUF4179 domain-containing protein [Solibacillus sp. CAU 1738]|uniref:DUF4179 domain-containing protein n=1 Tax=Solibacillus sp. CAU 1738 TaxID=3140363 RepID=UPI00325FE6A7